MKYQSCIKCQRGWCLEPKTPIWKGTESELRKHEYENRRVWNHCYCGTYLYEEKIK